MATIQCPSIEKPHKEFLCDVIRPQSNIYYQDGKGNLHPLHGEESEQWVVLAETIDGAMKIAKYHFFLSKILNVTER